MDYDGFLEYLEDIYETSDNVFLTGYVYTIGLLFNKPPRLSFNEELCLIHIAMESLKSVIQTHHHDYDFTTCDIYSLIEDVQLITELVNICDLPNPDAEIEVRNVNQFLCAKSVLSDQKEQVWQRIFIQNKILATEIVTDI